MFVPKEQLPVIIRQLWMAILPDGSRCDAGASYHLTEAHRAAYVQEVASSMAGPDEAREEPVGDATPMHTGALFYRDIGNRGGSYRIK